MQPSQEFKRSGVRILRHYFDLAASRYAADIEPAFAPLAAGLVGFAGIRNQSRIIDLGAGTGVVMRAALGAGFEVVSVDFSRLMLAGANAKGSGGLLQSDIHALPFASDSVDLALASFAFNSTDPAESFREVFRVIRPDGRLVFQEWGGPDDLSEIVSDTLVSYMVDEPSPALQNLRDATEIPVPWDELETIDDIRDAVIGPGFEIERLEVIDEEVRFESLDEFLLYKLAWPSRSAEVKAMSDEVRRLMMSDLHENLGPHVQPDGGLIWRPEVIRISAGKSA